ncbi:expressed unknown protein [Seminavis robusta]|uniref:C-type lectin domain-containing protein n=1 Tax=Seminavis robusta TaxID=568900 RepID=A0A9N8EFB0_9STRA|nr:expressed unknown protein [Seminavis robusta]|eukprot:Sro1038_g234340.1 n/a (341) ;mRNA; f:37591-38740
MKMKAKTLLSLLLGLSISVENLTKAQDVLPVPTGAGSTGATTDHQDMVAFAEAILNPDPDSEADAIYDSYDSYEDKDDLEEEDDEQAVVAKPDEQDLTEDTNKGMDMDMDALGSAFDTATASLSAMDTTDPKAIPDPTRTLGIKKDINPQVDAHDRQTSTNRITKPDKIIVMGHTSTSTEFKQDTDDITESVKASTTDHHEQEQDQGSLIYDLSNKMDVESSLEAMKRRAAADYQVSPNKNQEEEEEEEEEEADTDDAVSVRRHGRRLDETTDWLIGNTRMYGPRETASLPDEISYANGWTNAQNFCKEQGGSLASIKEICPPDGTTNGMPLFGMQGGDQ